MFIGHPEYVCDIQYSDINGQLASGSFDKSAIIWNYIAKRKLRTFNHYSAITCIAFAQNGKYLITGDISGNIIVWNISNGKKHSSIAIAGRVNSIATHNDMIIAGGNDNAVTIWAIESHLIKKLATTTFTSLVEKIYTNNLYITIVLKNGLINIINYDCTNVTVLNSNLVTVSKQSNGGELLAVCSDYECNIWNPSLNIKLWSLADQKSTISCIDWAPDDKHIYFGTNDCHVYCYNMENGKEEFVIKLYETVTCLTVNKFGTFLAVGTSDGIVSIHDTKTCEKFHTICFNEQITQTMFSADGKYLACVLFSGKIHLENMEQFYNTFVLLYISDNDTKVINMNIDRASIENTLSEYLQKIDTENTIHETLPLDKIPENIMTVYRRDEAMDTVQIFERKTRVKNTWLFNYTENVWVKTGYLKIACYK
jgi:WD40 repeat protein